ncbi:MAG: TonB-dependent receptor plug domain-containing protein [Saprospiraceae bacterium]
MKKYLSYLFCAMSFFAQGQNDSTSNPIELNTVVIGASKTAINKREVSQQIETITAKEIRLQNFQNTADMLGNSGTIAIQKSQQGGGSTVIRGLEANKVLYVVDGVRMNNLIFRAGHLQNILTVDENIIARADVVFGSSSTIYGSDALGGTIFLETLKPKLKDETEKTYSGNAFARFGTVNQEKKFHADLNIAGKKWASLTSITRSIFDDLKMGSRQNGDNDFFGARKFYVQNFNGKDSLVKNSDSLLQKFSAYQQFDIMQKVLYKQSDKIAHDLNFQFSTTNDVPRYDRLTDPKGNGLSNAEWYYGPAKRILAGYNLNAKDILAGQKLHLGIHYQNAVESRHQRRFGSSDRQHRYEDVKSINLNVDINKNFENLKIQYGLEIQNDKLKSSANKENIINGMVSPLDTRYPNGDNSMFHSDLYGRAQYTIKEKTILNFGLRGGYALLHSTHNDTTFFRLPYSTIDQKNLTYSGSLGIVHNPFQNLKLSANICSGYRVPNMDDLSKIFDTAVGTLIVPNSDLKPEKTITFDGGVTLWKGRKMQWENTGYYTRLIDAIVTSDFKYNGKDSTLYQGVLSRVVANQNLRKAYIIGFSSNLKVNITPKLMVYAGVSYTKGRIVAENADTPIDHIPPAYGKFGIRYQNNKLTTDFYMLFNGKKDIKDYYLNGEDNEQYAPKNGMPAWQTYNLKASYQVAKSFTIQAGIENILDIQYRTFASGINAPGRNFYGTVRYGF